MINKYRLLLEEAIAKGQLGHTVRAILRLQAIAFDEGCEMTTTRLRKEMHRKGKGKCDYCPRKDVVVTVVRFPGGFTCQMCLDCSAHQLKVGQTASRPKNRPEPSIVSPRLL